MAIVILVQEAQWNQSMHFRKSLKIGFHSKEIVKGQWPFTKVTLGCNFHISSAIRQSFFSFQNNLKNLDPSYKAGLDLSDCLVNVKLEL